MNVLPGDPVPMRVPGTFLPLIEDMPRATPAGGLRSIDTQPMMVSRAMLQLSNTNATQELKIKILREAIQRALADEESGNGWGPDSTVCMYLRKALKDSE